MIDTVLNLNAPHVVEARRRVMMAHQRKIVALRTRHRGLTAARRAEVAAALRNEAETAEYATALLAIADRVERAK
ncbi:hypothetical protein [Tsukamurella sp. NPDC003166]|uniref:hypothetical protein n=1 Tax=Tsukamurella sp. NPDC003166 TaxID=3154444 RepID=UPI0033B52286